MPKHIAILLLIVFNSITLSAQKFKDQNQPEVDFKPLHFGFMVGLNTQNLLFNHVDQSANAEKWYAEIPSYSPGFTVGLMADLLLDYHFNLRFTPSLNFGSKEVHFRELNSNTIDKQQLKSNYLLFPLELKYSALRLNNSRPYLLIGGAGGIDISRKQGESELIRLNAIDYYIEVGVGCDFYKEYFKLIPELKFCFGLRNMLLKDRKDLLDTPEINKYTHALSGVTSRLVVLSFYFE